MSKWVEMRTAQVAEQTAKNTRAMAAQQAETAANTDARIAFLEGRVAALEARVQWCIDVIQHMERAQQQGRQPS